MAENYNIQDPSQIGVGGLRGLNYNNTPIDESTLVGKRVWTPQTPEQYNMLKLNPNEQLGFVGINDSRLDKQITTRRQLENIEDTRGKLQSTASQLVNALGQGVTTAGTTFLNGTVGLVIGAIEAATTGEMSGMWDNDFTRTLKSVNDWAEREMPMHMTDKERESIWNSWNENFGNFVGNLLLKPAGFVAGAALSGGAWAGSTTKAIKGISALAGAGRNLNAGAQAAQGLNAAKNWINAGNTATKIVGSVTSTAGEAAIEALNNSDENYKKNKQIVDDHYNSIVEERFFDIIHKVPDLPQDKAIELAINEANDIFNYQEALDKLEQDRVSTGNMDYWLNFPILMASNIWQFGRFYSRGFNANKRALNQIKKVGNEYVANTRGGSYAAVKLAGNSFAEGQEEMLQAVAAETASKKYGSEFNSFYGARILPNAEENVQSLLSSINASIAEVYSDPERYFEMLSGGLMGVGGNIRINNKRESLEEGKYRSPIYFESFTETREEDARAELLAEQMNERVSSPEFKERYQGMIRHIGLEEAKKTALDKNDQYTYENADHEQLISDVILFDKAGRLQDLNDLIDEASTISDDDVQSIRKDSTNEEGKSPFDDLSDDQIKENFSNRAKNLKQSISDYTKISRNLETVVGDIFQDRELEELAYMMSQVGNWDIRFTELFDQLREDLAPYIDRLVNQNLNSEEKQEAINQLTTLINTSPMSLLSTLVLDNNMNNLDVLNQLYKNNQAELTGNKVLESIIKETIKDAKNNNDRESLIAALDRVKSKVNKNAEIQAKFMNISKNLDDMMKIAVARASFLTKYKGFLKNPQELREFLSKQESDILSESVKKKKESLKNSLSTANNTLEFDQILSAENDVTLKDDVVNSLIESGNNLASEYKNEFNYINNVNKKLDSIEGLARQNNAKTLYNNFKKTNSGIANIADPNKIASQTKESVGLNNLSDNEFSDALTDVLNAVYDVNESNDYVNRFSDNYKRKTIKKNINNIIKPEEIPASQPPVGELSDEVIEEIKEEIQEIAIKYNESKIDKHRLRGSNNKVVSNYFYRPAISNVRPERFDPKLGGKERYDRLFVYLVSEGAFRYVDDGNLKVGDEIRFVINPAVDPDAIFMAVGDRSSKNWQIVGSLQESGFAINNSVGLKDLINKVKSEFAKTSGTEAYMATPVVKVTELMAGSIKYDRISRPLNEIENTEDPIFGIVKNGILNTNGRLSNSDIELANALTSREGSVYLLTKTIYGKYRPIALRTARFMTIIQNSIPSYFYIAK